YKLAQTIEPLKYLNHKDHWNRLYMSCMLAHLTLDKLDSETVEVPLKRCRPEAQQLQNAMCPITSSQQERTDLEPADIVSIHFAAEKFETVLAMELREIDVFYVPPIAIFSTSALLNDPKSIFFERAK